jgi:hypothetical protein
MSRPKMQGYDVEVTAYALRTIRVRAASGADALAKAEARIAGACGPWSIDFPGAVDEHFSVTRAGDGWIVGPNSAGGFNDEDEEGW